MGRSRAKKQSAFPRPADSRSLPPALLAAVLVAVTLLVYLPAMRNGFVFDDGGFLTSNPLIKAPDGIRLFWFSTQPSDYFPLTSTMLWFEWRLWHMDPAGYHVVNILLHALSAVLVWRVLARLIPQGGTGAWLAGLIFAIHPVCVASVAWITEGKNTLSLALFLASLLLYLRFDESDSAICNLLRKYNGLTQRRKAAKHDAPERYATAAIFMSPRVPTGHERLHSALCNRLYLSSLLLFLLALLAKTSVVMLPAVLLLCVWWRRGRISRRDLLRAAPFFLLALALSAVTVWFQYHRVIAEEAVRTDGLLARTAGAGWAVWFYLWKALLPIGLCFVYPRWTTSASLLSFLPDFLLLAAMLLFWMRRRCNSGRRVLRPDVGSLSSRSRGADGCRPADAGPQGTAADWGRPFFFGLGYFLLMLLPVAGFLNIYFMRYSLVADHWQYAALIGPIALASAGAASWAGRRKRPAALYCCAAVLAALGAATWEHSHVYRTEETLWLDTLWKNPRAWVAWNNLGWTYHEAGLSEKAIPYFDRAIALKPDCAEAFNNLAVALNQLGRHAEALNDCTSAIRWDPNDARPYINRASALNQLGRCAEALDDCNSAIRLDPTAAVAYLNRSAALIGMGRCRLAVADCGQAIHLDPDYADAYCNRALAYFQLKEYEKAVADVKKCMELGGRPDPGFLKDLSEALQRRE